MLRHDLPHLLGVGVHDLDFDPVTLPDAVDHVVCLLRQPPCVEREHGQVGADP